MANKFGIQVGDIFKATWGYDQTNNDFFQVVELVGDSSARVAHVSVPIAACDEIGFCSENRTYEITGEPMPHLPSSWFIKDNERGDLKRIKSDGSNPYFRVSSYCDARKCEKGLCKVYESWYG